MSQQVRSREVGVESRHIATHDKQILGDWLAVARAGGTVLVAAMATGGWQATRSGMTGLFGHRGPAGQAAIGVELDAHAALVSQAANPDEVRQDLATVWQLELAALLRHHPETLVQLRALVVRVWETLPIPQQTWVRTTIARNQATQVTGSRSPRNFLSMG
ncbi:MAG: hypothetical protein LC808_33325 [Actinobacteria bacterium]|nr:hypothetical protein [Actinomycetota bacterium]